LHDNADNAKALSLSHDNEKKVEESECKALAQETDKVFYRRARIVDEAEAFRSECSREEHCCSYELNIL